jgi:hypothetical protein
MMLWQRRLCLLCGGRSRYLREKIFEYILGIGYDVLFIMGKNK